MHSRKQLALVIDRIIASELDSEMIESQTINEYQKLNDKCDNVIGKIKKRKKRKIKTVTGE